MAAAATATVTPMEIDLDQSPPREVIVLSPSEEVKESIFPFMEDSVLEYPAPPSKDHAFFEFIVWECLITKVHTLWEIFPSDQTKKCAIHLFNRVIPYYLTATYELIRVLCLFIASHMHDEVDQVINITRTLQLLGLENNEDNRKVFWKDVKLILYKLQWMVLFPTKEQTQFPIAAVSFKNLEKQFKAIKRTRMGQGSFGQVDRILLQRNDTQDMHQVACKTFTVLLNGKSEDDLRNFLTEVNILRYLHNVEGVPKLFYVEFGRFFCTLGRMNMDQLIHTRYKHLRSKDAMAHLTRGGDLHDYAYDFTVQEVRHWVYQLATILTNVLDIGVCHRDLKPANIMLTEDLQLFIIDWGAAKLGNLDQEEIVHSPMTTCWYRAPEAWQTKYRSDKLDVWALGCIFVELLTRQPAFPFEKECDEKAAQAFIIERLRQFEKDPKLKSHWRLISSMLVIDPACRISMPDVLIHPAWCPLKRKHSF